MKRTYLLPADRIAHKRWFGLISYRIATYGESARAAAEWLKTNHDKGDRISNVVSLVSSYHQRERQ